jgi:uncharacterized protein (TIGR02145 family)
MKWTDPRDGHVYRVVKMPDGKYWLAENYSYAVAGGVPYSNDHRLGLKYNRYMTMTQDFLTDGWRVPTRAEWESLIAAIGADPGRKLKAMPPDWNGTDDFGWAGLNTNTELLPPFNNYSNGWWNSNSHGVAFTWVILMGDGDNTIWRESTNIEQFAVRLIRDDAPPMPKPITDFTVIKDGKEYQSENGMVQIPSLPNGEYEFVGRANGREDYQGRVTIDGGDISYVMEMVKIVPPTPPAVTGKFVIDGPARSRTNWACIIPGTNYLVKAHFYYSNGLIEIYEWPNINFVASTHAILGYEYPVAAFHHPKDELKQLHFFRFNTIGTYSVNNVYIKYRELFDQELSRFVFGPGVDAGYAYTLKISATRNMDYLTAIGATGYNLLRYNYNTKSYELITSIEMDDGSVQNISSKIYGVFEDELHTMQQIYKLNSSGKWVATGKVPVVDKTNILAIRRCADNKHYYVTANPPGFVDIMTGEEIVLANASSAYWIRQVGSTCNINPTAKSGAAALNGHTTATHIMGYNDEKTGFNVLAIGSPSGVVGVESNQESATHLPANNGFVVLGLNFVLENQEFSELLDFSNLDTYECIVTGLCG